MKNKTITCYCVVDRRGVRRTAFICQQDARETVWHYDRWAPANAPHAVVRMTGTYTPVKKAKKEARP